MGNLRACFVVAISALAAACGDDGGAMKIADASIDTPSPDAKIFMDAPPPMFDFTCTANTTAPTNAAAMITIGGTVQAVGFSGGSLSIDPVDGASVKLCESGAANCTGGNTDGSATTNAQGEWSIGPFATAGAAQDDFVDMSGSVRQTFVYPASPFVADQANVPVLTFGTGADLILGGLGCSSSASIIGLAVTDCAGAPVTDSANVVITVKQGGTTVPNLTVVALGDNVPEAAGTFLICGVPANAATEVSAKYMSTNFIAHTVKTVAGTTTATIVIPGY